MWWKCCTQYGSKFGKLNRGHRTEKGQFSFQSIRKAMHSTLNRRTIALISHASNAQDSPRQASTIREPWNFRCSSWFQKRLWNQRSNWQHLLDHQKSKRVPEKQTMPKPLTVWITTNCGKLWKRWGYKTSLTPSWEICIQVRNQWLEVDMEQQIGSK